METGAGRFLIEFDSVVANEPTVTVARIDPDGLVGEKKAWSERWGHRDRDETLATFLSRRGVPYEDAGPLADEILGSWLRDLGWRPEHGLDDGLAETWRLTVGR